MKKWIAVFGVSALLWSCSDAPPTPNAKATNDNFSELLNNYWEERLQLFPVEATAYGDNRYNNKLTITIATSFRDSLSRFYNRYLQLAQQADTAGMKATDKLNWRLFCHEMQMSIEGLKYPSHWLPINQFSSFLLELPQLGAGTGNQPFKTVADYDQWLQRLAVLPAWVDTAIANMKQGIDNGWVLPRALVAKMLPQLKAIVTKNDTQSIFWGPIRQLPEATSEADRARLTSAWHQSIETVVNPAYLKMYTFLHDEYLPASRSSSGIGAMKGGADWYNYCIRYWTTTALSPDSIYNTGIAEVARIEGEMNKIREEAGFKGNLQEFFKYVGNNKQFFPFTNARQVIDSFEGIHRLEEPMVKKLFSLVPKTKFTIRQTEAFREASASAEYNQGSEDGTRPGIFYVPVPDATKFNCVGMATLFLHEAIPGHHYQLSLQQENKGLPSFRRFLWYGAYGEGWAHYCETLGRDLGVYNDPWQYFGHLSDAIHRAIRLVVDVGIHHKGMLREEAISYMRAHELISEAEATAEIERYMALPGQALSYKIGQMTISAERRKYEQLLGAKFDIASFHDEVLRDGCVPLDVLKEKLEQWSKAAK
jgi:uncharacterized protein (DUF885 family)